MLTEIPGFSSKNSLVDVAAGSYELVETSYGGVASGTSAVIKELISIGRAEVVACDLIVVLADGTVLFRDFVKLRNGDWRDSYGRCADDLGELMPPELSELRKVESATYHSELKDGYFQVCESKFTATK